MVTHRVDWLDPIFAGLSRIGNWGLVWLVLALLGAWIWRKPNLPIRVAAAVLFANLIALALKGLTSRDRPAITNPEPPPLVRTPLDLSFPSGHAASSFAAALILARAAPSRAPIFFALAVAISFSRVYVGVHYPVDVLAGAVLGVLVATALLALAGVPRRRGQAPPAG